MEERDEDMRGVDGVSSDSSIIGRVLDGMGRGRRGGRRGGRGGRRGGGPIIIDRDWGYPYYDLEDLRPVNVIIVDPDGKKKQERL